MKVALRLPNDQCQQLSEKRQIINRPTEVVSLCFADIIAATSQMIRTWLRIDCN